MIQALSGLASVQGGGAARPRLVRTILPDKLTAIQTAQAITAALLARARTGEGSHVHISMLDTGRSGKSGEVGPLRIPDEPGGTRLVENSALAMRGRLAAAGGADDATPQRGNWSAESVPASRRAVRDGCARQAVPGTAAFIVAGVGDVVRFCRAGTVTGQTAATDGSVSFHWPYRSRPCHFAGIAV